MKIGITGANGYIGSNLVKFLLIKSEYEITALIHKNDNNISGLNIRTISGSVTDKNSLDLFTKDQDIVIHLASVQSTVATEKDFEKVIYNGAQNIIESSLKNQVKPILYML